MEGFIRGKVGPFRQGLGVGSGLKLILVLGPPRCGLDTLRVHKPTPKSLT
jgi:hypothetical protein